MNEEEKLDQYAIVPFKEEIELIDSGFKYEENKLEIESNEKNVESPYSYFNENQLADLKIDIHNEYSKKLLECKFKIEEVQQQSFESILKQISDIIPPKNFELIFTQENEIQFFRKLKNASASIIIDEFGGITLAIIGEKGLGYKYDYLNADQVDTKKTILFAQHFLSDYIS